MTKFFLFFIVTGSFLFGKDHFARQKFSADSLFTENAVKDEWIARDKGLHLAGSFISTGLLTMSARKFTGVKNKKSKTIAISVSFSLALAKEVCDSRQQDNHFSYKDLTADIVGIVLAVIVFR